LPLFGLKDEISGHMNVISLINCSSFYLQLMAKAPNARLGCSVNPGEEREIKDHLFYRNINWQKLADREVQPPFKPHVVSLPLRAHMCLRAGIHLAFDIYYHSS
jgi:hypothetical protein